MNPSQAIDPLLRERILYRVLTREPHWLVCLVPVFVIRHPFILEAVRFCVYSVERCECFLSFEFALLLSFYEFACECEYDPNTCLLGLCPLP